MAGKPAQFKYQVGGTLYLRDMLTRISKSVFRVKILALDDVTGRPRYLVRPTKKPDFTPWLMGEEDLTIEPSAGDLSPCHRAHWKHMRR